MAIGDTVQAGLMRVDFSPIARAGEAQARGNQAFGLGFERMVDRFNQRVKEKQAKEERDRAYRLQKMIADRNFEMQVGQLGLQQAAAEQSMAAKAKADQLADKAMQDKVALSNFLMSGTEMDPEVVEDFNQAQPGLFALGGDEGARNRFLEYQRDTAPKTGPLGGELGSSDFARFAKEQGLDPVLAGNYFMNLQKAEAEAELANQPKAPDPQVQIKNENDLRKEFNSLPEVKDFNKVRTSYDKVVLAGENPSAAGDISMIFNYMKILDPGSVVREGEFATAQNAAGVPQRVINQYNKIVKGERLSEDQRSDFMNQARFAAEAQFKPVSEQMTRYQGVARNMGLRLDQVLPASFLTMGEQLRQKFKTKPDSNSDFNAITTDQGNYTIPGLSVEAQ